MLETVENELVKTFVPVLFQRGMKMFDGGKVREELAEANRKLAATSDELADTKRKLAEKDDKLDEAQAMFDAYRDRQELILWGGSFLIIILLAIMITSVRQGGCCQVAA
jgi:hypothetical protein